MIARARHRLTRLPARLADPVAEANRRTSAADARTALCLARGTAVDDIDPASGMDTSHDAYQRTRAAWVQHLAAAGPTWHVVQACRRAGDRWRQLRPQWAAELPWPHSTDTRLTTKEKR